MLFEKISLAESRKARKIGPSAICFSRCPYEEGTERLQTADTSHYPVQFQMKTADAKGQRLLKPDRELEKWTEGLVYPEWAPKEFRHASNAAGRGIPSTA